MFWNPSALPTIGSNNEDRVVVFYEKENGWRFCTHSRGRFTKSSMRIAVSPRYPTFRKAYRKADSFCGRAYGLNSPYNTDFDLEVRPDEEAPGGAGSLEAAKKHPKPTYY